MAVVTERESNNTFSSTLPKVKELSNSNSVVLDAFLPEGMIQQESVEINENYSFVNASSLRVLYTFKDFLPVGGRTQSRRFLINKDFLINNIEFRSIEISPVGNFGDFQAIVPSTFNNLISFDNMKEGYINPLVKYLTFEDEDSNKEAFISIIIGNATVKASPSSYPGGGRYKVNATDSVSITLPVASDTTGYKVLTYSSDLEKSLIIQKNTRESPDQFFLDSVYEIPIEDTFGEYYNLLPAPAKELLTTTSIEGNEQTTTNFSPSDVQSDLPDSTEVAEGPPPESFSFYSYS